MLPPRPTSGPRSGPAARAFMARLLRHVVGNSPTRGHHMVTGDVAGDEHGGSWMTTRFEGLVDQLHRGKIDRRAFIVRAIALGATGSAVVSALSRGALVAAQEGGAASIGKPDIKHVERTDKGTIKVYSSWPRT